MANAIIQLPIPYIGDFSKGRPLFNASIYVGVPDLDPEIPANQLQIVGIQEDGAEVNLNQPVLTGSGGYPTYNGSPVRLSVDGAYSLKINDKQGSQEYYFSNVLNGAPLTTEDIRSRSLDSLTSAVAFVTTNPTTIDRLTTASYRNPAECLALSIPYPDGGGASYIVEALGTPDGYGDHAAGAKQLTLSVPNRVNPIQYGLAGNGSSDDILAMAALLTSGRAIDWMDRTYSITGMISETITSGIDWVSNGATIINNSSTSVGRTIELLTGGYDHSIVGKMTIDANDKSYIGLRLENTTSDKANFLAEDLECKNAFREAQSFVGGSGLNIKGYFETLTLVRPVIRNCHLGAGAGISGIVGISGILIEPKGTTPFEAVENCHIEDPYVEDVYSDDLLYVIDQDGINFRTAGDDPLIDLPWPTQFNVDGGVFKNCWGRSIKSQSESSYIDNVHLIRTTGNEHNGSDIDLQVGGGSVTRIRCTYEAFTPNWVVTASGARRDGKLVAFTTVSDIKVSIAAGESINAVVNCANREFTRQSWLINDLVVRGGSVDYAVRLTGGLDSTNLLSLSDVNIDTLNEYLVWTGVNSFSDDAKVIIKRAFHAGTPVDLFRANSITSPLLSSEDVFGFNDVTRVDQVGSGTVGPFLRVDKIAPIDATESGFLKPVSFLLANDAIFDFPIVGYSTGSNMVLISCSANKQSKGVFGYDTGSVISLMNEGTSFEVGATTEPVTGLFRLWSEGGTMRISNRSGATRMFTCLMLG